MTRAQLITVDCLTSCGRLGDGLSTDPPGPKPRNWKGPYGDGVWGRADELERVAGRHPHPTRIRATPQETR
jgi:hypothetical protein